MGEKTAIGWTHHTFNSWWGCVHVSPGCEKCFAETFAARNNVGWGVKAERKFFGEHHWMEPFAWDWKAQKSGERRRVFCASMADVFEDRPELEGYRTALWFVIENTPWLDWLLLTKRPDNIIRFSPEAWRNGKCPTNVWLGTSVENQEWLSVRCIFLAEAKKELGARVSFLSLEPLLGGVNISLWLQEDNEDWPDPPLDWVIVGAEAGSGRRPFEVEWLADVAEQCKGKVALYVKQDSGRYPGNQGRIPDELWIHEFPR